MAFVCYMQHLQPVYSENIFASAFNSNLCRSLPAFTHELDLRNHFEEWDVAIWQRCESKDSFHHIPNTSTTGFLILFTSNHKTKSSIWTIFDLFHRHGIYCWLSIKWISIICWYLLIQVKLNDACCCRFFFFFFFFVSGYFHGRRGLRNTLSGCATSLRKNLNRCHWRDNKIDEICAFSSNITIKLYFASLDSLVVHRNWHNLTSSGYYRWFGRCRISDYIRWLSSNWTIGIVKTVAIVLLVSKLVRTLEPVVC